MAIRGSCLCGGVTFEIDKAVGPVEFCHCNRCRKVSGSAALLMISVSTADYRFPTGRELVRTYAAPILYNPPAYHHLLFQLRLPGPPAPYAGHHGRVAQELGLHQPHRVALRGRAREDPAGEELESPALQSNLTLGRLLYSCSPSKDEARAGDGASEAVDRGAGPKATCRAGGLTI
jgi:hypothetical protein